MESKFKKASDRRVAIFFAEGLEEVEALSPADILFRAGIPRDLVAITPERLVQTSHDVYVRCDRTICDEDFSFDDYDLLFLPGGMPGTLNLKACEPLTEAVKRFAAEGAGTGAEGKQVAAICAAPSILAELGLLEGRHATANPNFQHVLVEHGATVEAASPVVEDDNIVTSQGMGTSVDLGLALVRRLLGEEAAARVREGIVVLH
ncbi:MAG: DJ-1 family glyoxalase III [Olegusella sp.]|nr:DJ-1 family glyoxalase III [Olegusella sp.]